MTAIVKLGLLSFKPPLTKISIVNNRIFYNDPSIFQGLSRWVRGDSRNKYHYLYFPILFFCHLKFNGHLYPQIYHRESIEELNQLALNGLACLKDIYKQDKESLINVSLDLYITLLSTDDVNDINKKFDESISTLKGNYEEYLKCWSSSNLDVICHMFAEMKTKKNDKEFLVKSIESMEQYLESLNVVIDRYR